VKESGATLKTCQGEKSKALGVATVAVWEVVARAGLACQEMLIANIGRLEGMDWVK
jgi:hypothetical protein